MVRTETIKQSCHLRLPFHHSWCRQDMGN